MRVHLTELEHQLVTDGLVHVTHEGPYGDRMAAGELLARIEEYQRDGDELTEAGVRLMIEHERDLITGGMRSNVALAPFSQGYVEGVVTFARVLLGEDCPPHMRPMAARVARARRMREIPS